MESKGLPLKERNSHTQFGTQDMPQQCFPYTLQYFWLDYLHVKCRWYSFHFTQVSHYMYKVKVGENTIYSFWSGNNCSVSYILWSNARNIPIIMSVNWIKGSETSRFMTAWMAPDLPFKGSPVIPTQEYIIKNLHNLGVRVVVAEWLRRWTRNPLGSARAGSNPADYGIFFSSFFFHSPVV